MSLGRQWQMTTNMKAAPNSQGTLFQGNNAQRYPRGYTPERQISVLANLHPETYAALKSEPTTRAIVDNVKRSSVPVETIRNVKFVGAGGPMGRQRGMHGGLTIGGSYQGTTKFNEDFSRKILGGVVKVAAGQEDNTTPIHELGHHQSRLLERPSSKYDTPARKGADEGFAETFAERNWRDRRGRPAQDFTTNPRKWTGNMGSKAEGTFVKHFEKEREGSPQSQRQAGASASYAARGAQGGLFEPDLSLKGRKSTKGVAQGGLAKRLGDVR